MRDSLDARGNKEKGESPQARLHKQHAISSQERAHDKDGRKRGGSKDRPKKQKKKKPPPFCINDETRICLSLVRRAKKRTFPSFPQTSPTKLIDGRGGGGRFPKSIPNLRIQFISARVLTLWRTNEAREKKKFSFFFSFLFFWCFFQNKIFFLLSVPYYNLLFHVIGGKKSYFFTSFVFRIFTLYVH